MYPQTSLQSSTAVPVVSEQLSSRLSRLKISGYANNELRIQLSTTPQSRKNLGDRAETRHAERRAKLLAQIEFIRKCQIELLAGKEPEIWIPQGGDGITTTRIHDDICEIDNRVYAEAFKKTGVAPSRFDSQVRAAIAEWQAKNFSYPIPIDFTPVTKEVFKKWDKKITPQTEWLESEPGETNLFYRAVPCCDRIEVPVSRVGKLPGTALKVTWVKHTVTMVECERVLAAANAALDIRNVLQEMLPLGSDNPQRSFTRQARHTLLEAGAVTDKLAGLNAVCVTLTLPGSTSESIRALAAYSSWILNNLMQTIRDWRKKFKKQIEYFYVWELQKRGALHIHICVTAAPDEESLERLMKLGHKVKDTWYVVLKEMATTKRVKRFGKKEGNLPGIDMFARANQNGKIKSWRNKPHRWEWDVQKVHKSVAAYFAKYAGKNGAPANKNQLKKIEKANGKCYAPSRWSGKSRGIQKAIKASRFEYEVTIADLQNSPILAAIRAQLELSPVVKGYEYSWQVLDTKYKEAIVNGKKHYCKKGLAKRELEPVMLASEGINPTRTLIEGHTEIYYFEPEEWQQHWDYWSSEKELFYTMTDKVRDTWNTKSQRKHLSTLNPSTDVYNVNSH